MSTEDQELSHLIDKAGEIQQFVVQRMDRSPGGTQVGGNNNVTYVYQAGKFSQELITNLENVLKELRAKVSDNLNEIPKAQRVLDDINRISEDIKENEPDPPSILSRARDIALAVGKIAALVPLAKQLLSFLTSLFSRI